MTAKAAARNAAKSSQTLANGNWPQSVRADYRLIQWIDLQTSPTNPRRRIDQTTIENLADSLKSQGILEPLIVRQVENKFEIVCGERRYRAAKIAAMSDVPCLVRELTDEQVLDIQIHENLHREDVHPMDEAYSYHFLREKLGCDVKELAVRVGKPEGYVLNRLKLNLLIKEAQKDIDEGQLPLVYALEMAKYAPEVQKLIYAEVYRTQGRYQGEKHVSAPVKGETVPWKSFIGWINTNVHRLLAKAPFDPRATNLRNDRLACMKCPERTGAAVSLFEPNQIGKKDACLNPACYKQKIEMHVEVLRRELAETRKVDVSQVPIVRSWCYSDGKDYLGSESATVIGDMRGASKKKCKKAVTGIDIEAENYGRTVQVCLKISECRIHWPAVRIPSIGQAPNGRSPEMEAAEKLENHRARREEIWNAKVAEAVRKRVFKQAAEKFEKKFRMTDVGTDFLPQLVSRFWRMSSAGDSGNLNGVVIYLVSEWQGKKDDPGATSMKDGRSEFAFIKSLDRSLQIRILFLLAHCYKGAVGYGNSYTSQTEVRDLAAEFDVDYTLVDSEVRLELSAKRHVEVHKSYLDDIRRKSKGAKIPQLFSSRWKAAD